MKVPSSFHLASLFFPTSDDLFTPLFYSQSEIVYSVEIFNSHPMPYLELVSSFNGEIDIRFIGEIQFVNISESMAKPVTFFICEKIFKGISYEFAIRRGCLDEKINVSERVCRACSDCEDDVVAVQGVIHGYAE